MIPGGADPLAALVVAEAEEAAAVAVAARPAAGNVPAPVPVPPTEEPREEDEGWWWCLGVGGIPSAVKLRPAMVVGVGGLFGPMSS